MVLFVAIAMVMCMTSVVIICIKLRVPFYFKHDFVGFDKQIPSPRVKQQGWQNFFGNEIRIDRSTTIKLPESEDDKLISASYSNEPPYSVVTGSYKGSVTIWTADTQVLLTIPGRGHAVSCVTFSDYDSLIIFSSESSIFLHNADTGEFLSSFLNKTHIISLLVVPESETSLIAIGTSSIILWNWSQDGIKIANPSMTELSNISNFLCAAVTDDGLYLVAGSTDHYVRMWHIGTGKIVQEFLNNKG